MKRFKFLFYVLVFALLLSFFQTSTIKADDDKKVIRVGYDQNSHFIQEKNGAYFGYGVEYLKKISNRITLFGATFLAFIALVPSIVFGAIGGSGITSAFSATGLLIVVSVAIEFDKQLEALMLMRNYKGFLNK